MTSDYDELTFGECDHEWTCWRCGSRQDSAPNNRLGNFVAAVVALLLLAVTITPLLWLVRVSWAWAL
jgi:hypothetical protein